jgi:hypothetical protein
MSEETIEAETPVKHWIAIGKKYKKEGSVAVPNEDQDIPIMECARSVSMDKDKQAYGQPIDAKWGIHLIKNLFNQLHESNILQYLFADEFLKVKEVKQENLAVTEGDGADKQGEGMDKEKEELLQWLIRLLWHSKAITIDKNILLKALSQPLCEGLRFYLCLTPPLNGKGPQGETIHGLPKGTFSLVTIGVDKKGHDLHYTFDPTIIKSDADIPEVATTSLVGEYGHPPGSGTSPVTTDTVTADSPYVLWNYALAQFKAEILDV